MIKFHVITEGLTGQARSDAMFEPPVARCYNTGGAAIADRDFLQMFTNGTLRTVTDVTPEGIDVKTADNLAAIHLVIGIAKGPIPEDDYGQYYLFSPGSVIHGVPCAATVNDGDYLKMSGAVVNQMLLGVLGTDRLLAIALSDALAGTCTIRCL